MNKIYIMASSIALLTVPSLSYAADIVVAPDVVVVEESQTYNSVYDFSGFYAGIQLGERWMKSETSVNGVDAGLTAKDDAFLGGLYFGYNLQYRNNVVLGLETDVAWDSLSNTSTVDDANYSLSNTVKEKWGGATRVRLGYAVGRFMPYLAGGVSYSQVENALALKSSNKTGNISTKDTKVGYNIGAGVDFAATNNLLLRLEYRYSTAKTDLSVSLPDMEYISGDTDYSTNDIRVGLAYKF